MGYLLVVQDRTRTVQEAYAHARRAFAVFRDGDALLVAGIYSRGDGIYLNGP